MHQSIPAVPTPPPSRFNPGGGAFEVLSLPGGRAFAYPRDDPGAFDKVRKTFRCSQSEVVHDLPFLCCCSLIDFAHLLFNVTTISTVETQA